MKKKIKAEAEAKQEDASAGLRNENESLKEYINLQDKTFYRRQTLIALNRIADALEESLESEDEEDSDEE